MTADKPSLISKGTMTVKDAAKYAGVCRAQLFVWMKDEGLPFVRFGRGKKRLIPRQGLEDFLESRVQVNAKS